MSVRYVSGDEESTFEITDSNDVGRLVNVLTEDTESGSGSCEFSQLELLFEGKDETLGIHPATDGCNIVFYKKNDDQYYVISSENKKIMLDILYKYGVPLDYDYLYEYMYED